MNVLDIIKRVLEEELEPIKRVKRVGKIHSALAKYNWKHRKRKTKFKKYKHEHQPVREDELDEISIRDAAGHMERLSNVPIRMANGKIKSMPPGKSGSSGGGGK
jgi:hypothetical protein